MADILFIKTSSLGDVIHHMPALSEAKASRPDARFAWLVEEAFVPLVKLHPAASEVIPVAWRRWRKSLWSPATLSEITASLHGVRTRHFDTVVDTQGLFRSGFMARYAGGVRHGYDRDSVREAAATIFYDVRHPVRRNLHAIERNRILTGLSLGYTLQGAPNYGLDRGRLREGDAPYAVLLHASARPEKEWGAENWRALAPAFDRLGIDLVLPWGTPAERERAQQLAANLPRARVGEYQPLDGVARLIAGASFVIGVDTGLLHLAAALGVPLVAIFAGSEPGLTGPVGQGLIEVVGSRNAPPSPGEVAQALGEILR